MDDDGGYPTMEKPHGGVIPTENFLVLAKTDSYEMPIPGPGYRAPDVVFLLPTTIMASPIPSPSTSKMRWKVPGQSGWILGNNLSLQGLEIKGVVIQYCLLVLTWSSFLPFAVASACLYSL